MFDNDLTQDGLRQDLDPELLGSLERQKSDEIAKARTHTRVEAKFKVVVRPGNASEALRFKLQGLTADLSRGGCRLILPMPVAVGDVFRIEFEAGEQRIPLTFARCLRCRLVREDAFEAGFSFFAPIELPARLSQGPSDLLG
ncbi:MAG: PilZ domain-containing protein [Planctomycetes bacterium]|nr:PilZ domain-containing protein [Planctomycetota bacterium]